MKRILSVAGHHLSLLLAVSLAMAAPRAAACGFHGPIEGNWTPLHSKSIDVAIAVRKAADKGMLDASLLDARAAGLMGMVRATKQLRELGLRFSERAGASSTAPSMTMLFVESSLWTRYTPTQQGIMPRVHVPGPERGDAVIVTSEAVIAAVLVGRLSMRQAIARGLITIDGPVNAARAAMSLFERTEIEQKRTERRMATFL